MTDMTDMESTSQMKPGALSPDNLKSLLARKWPETVYSESSWVEAAFITGHPAFDSLFPATGIPYGQLIEITGDTGSGKTSLLFLLLSGITRKGTAAYLDFSGSFFPAAAAACGVDISRVIVLRPRDTGMEDSESSRGVPRFAGRRRDLSATQQADRLRRPVKDGARNDLVGIPVLLKTAGHPFTTALRSAELIFRHHLACCVVFDLIGEYGQLPLTLLHRLRMQTVRAKALVIFLTEHQSNLIPASTTSLKLHVERNESGSLNVSVVRSRISREGIEAEVRLHE
jgi:hypothetical protein